MVLGAFGKTKIILGVIGAAWVFTSLVVSILGSVIYLTKTGDGKPLLQNTGGMIVGMDANVLLDVKELQRPDITKEYADYLKESIVRSILIFLGFIFLIYLGIQAIFRISLPPDSINMVLKLTFVVMALFLVTLASALYNGIVLHAWSFNPYQGITELVKNFDVFTNVGNQTIVKSLGEQLVNASQGGA